MRYKNVKAFARKMRLNPTNAEKKLWQYLRNRQLGNKKFLRQHPVFYEHQKTESFCFIPDFFCYEEKLAIELDGPIHDYRKEKDKKRDRILESMGIRVLRIKNTELNDIERVLKKIKSMYKSPLPGQGGG